MNYEKLIANLKALQKAHKRGYGSAGDKFSDGYHIGSYITIEQILVDLGEKTKIEPLDIIQ